jgi:hypothetical protein
VTRRSPSLRCSAQWNGTALTADSGVPAAAIRARRPRRPRGTEPADNRFSYARARRNAGDDDVRNNNTKEARDGFLLTRHQDDG